MLAVVMAAILVNAFTGVLANIRCKRQTGEIVKGAFELKILATDYAHSRSPRARQQWRSKCASFRDGLDAAETWTQRQRFIIDRMRNNHASLRRTFDALHGVAPDTPDARKLRRESMYNRMTAKLDACLLALFSDANQLSEAISREMVADQRKAILSVVLSSLAMVGVIVGLAVMINRSAIVPLYKLQVDTDVIGGGNLDHRARIESKDEVGDLSRAFDRMVDRLKSVMARRDELDREVTQRERAEHSLREALSDLKRSNQELEQFAYSASHDLQEPLRKVVAFGSLLSNEHGDRLEDEGRQYIEIMLKATRRMQDLINDLLTYSRVTTRGKAFVTVDMNEVVRGVLSDLETRIAETDATVDVGDLPEIEADPTQMRQLMQNLIGNALKFHRPGEQPHVKVRAVAAGAEGERPAAPSAPQCRIEVEDDGIGFEEKYTDRIFAVFQRLHQRQEYGGSGIGLSVCRRIVERHGGTITTRSRAGEGATFIVSLPVKQEQKAEEE